VRARVVLGAALCLGLSASRAFGWGEYGHEQVNGAAVRLLLGRHRGLAQFLGPNSALLRRLSITPDADWKSSFAQEPPLHFFEVDAFIAAEKDPNTIGLLPTGGYRDVYPQYRQLLASNAEYLQKMSPGKPLDPAAHGTAPWRVLQFYDLAVAAMRRHDPAQALFFLGVMGHYVADLAQPLHTTVDFDGERGGAPAAGVHFAFEEQILEKEALRRAGEAAPARDLRSGLWRTDATDQPVLAAAAEVLGHKRLAAIPRGSILPELFALVGGGYPLIQPLLQAFSRQCQAARRMASPGEAAAVCAPAFDSAGRSQPPQVPDLLVSAFATSALSVRAGRSSYDTTVLKAAQMRLAEAAVLLARLWVSAYESGGRPSFGPTVARFEDMHVLEAYPVPDYLPGPAPATERPTPSAAVEPITPIAAVLSGAAAYDRRILCLVGKASVLFRKDSRQGNPYYTFWLSAGGGKVKVFSFGRPEIQEGDELEACGRFDHEKHISGRIFFDELSAQSILRGRSIGAGYVQLTPTGVLPVKH